MKVHNEIIIASIDDFLDNIPDGHMESTIAGMPDWGDLTSDDLMEWKAWFRITAQKILKKTDDNGYAIFTNTDRKHKGAIISKSQIVISAALEIGYRVIWHKIAVRKGVNKTDLHRPAYTHLMCFSKLNTCGKAMPDVIMKGKTLYKDANGLTSTQFMIDFIKARGIKKVYDLFCGMGTISYVAKINEMDSVGVDLSESQCKKAEQLLMATML